jgi:hypothetical protein
LRWFEQCLKRNEDHVRAADNVAYLLSELHGKDPAAMKRALELAEKAMAMTSQRAQAMKTLGWILTRVGRAKDGLRLLQQAIVPLADDIRAHYHIAIAYEATGAAKMARLHLEHVISASKDKALADQARKAMTRIPKQPQATQASGTRP